jgi:hypothetical protein
MRQHPDWLHGPGQVEETGLSELNPANVYMPPTSQVQNTRAMPQHLDCWNCKQIGHAGSDCPEVQCFKCGNIGHISPVCTLSKRLSDEPGPSRANPKHIKVEETGSESLAPMSLMALGIDEKGLHEELIEVKQQKKILNETSGKLGQKIYILRKEHRSAIKKYKLEANKVKNLTKENKRLRLLKGIKTKKPKDTTMEFQHDKTKEDTTKNEPCKHGPGCLDTDKKGRKFKHLYSYSPECSINDAQMRQNQVFDHEQVMQQQQQQQNLIMQHDQIVQQNQDIEDPTKVHNSRHSSLTTLMPVLHTVNIANNPTNEERQVARHDQWMIQQELTINEQLRDYE